MTGTVKSSTGISTSAVLYSVQPAYAVPRLPRSCRLVLQVEEPQRTTSGRFRAAILTYPVDGIPLNSAGYVDRENPRRLVHLRHTPTCMPSARRAAGPGSAWAGSISAYPVGNEWLHILRQRPETA